MKLTLRDYHDKLPARIASRIEERPGPLATPCWVWTGHTVNGYASARWDGMERKLTKVVYELFVGPLGELVPDHLCRVRACLNVHHLEAVTQQVNILRGVGLAAQQSKRTHCPAGHPYDEANTVRRYGRRYCRACGGQRSREYRRRQR